MKACVRLVILAFVAGAMTACGKLQNLTKKPNASTAASGAAGSSVSFDCSSAPTFESLLAKNWTKSTAKDVNGTVKSTISADLNGDGLWKKRTHESSDGLSDYSEAYTYSEDGQSATITTLDRNGDTTDVETDTYSGGVIMKQEYTDGEGKVVHRDDYSYDSALHTMTDVDSYFDEAGNVSQEITWVYLHDDPANHIYGLVSSRLTSKKMQDGALELDEETQSTCDGQGNTITCVGEHRKYPAATLLNKATSVYTSSFFKIKSQDECNQAWTKTSDSLEFYDDAGHVTKTEDSQYEFNTQLQETSETDAVLDKATAKTVTKKLLRTYDSTGFDLIKEQQFQDDVLQEERLYEY